MAVGRVSVVSIVKVAETNAVGVLMEVEGVMLRRDRLAVLVRVSVLNHERDSLEESERDTSHDKVPLE